MSAPEGTHRPSALAEAYSATGGAWQAGPGPIYGRLAEVLVAACPGGVAWRRGLDLGAGTGAATRAALAAGASSVVAVDVALGMLAHDRRRRPPAVVADARALPLPDGSIGAVVAAFSLNHLADPAAGLAESARVLTPGGGLVAGAYAQDDTHPVKAIVEAVCARRGWEPAAWYGVMKAEAVPRMATVAAALDAAHGTGLHDVEACTTRVAFADLSPAALVAWRLGMANMAPFVARLPVEERDAVVAEALAELGPDPVPLERSIVVLVGRG